MKHAKKKAAAEQGEYVVVKGFNWGSEGARVEPGGSLDGVPSEVIERLLADGAVKPIDEVDD